MFQHFGQRLKRDLKQIVDRRLEANAVASGSTQRVRLYYAVGFSYLELFFGSLLVSRSMLSPTSANGALQSLDWLFKLTLLVTQLRCLVWWFSHGVTGLYRLWCLLRYLCLQICSPSSTISAIPRLSTTRSVPASAGGTRSSVARLKDSNTGEVLTIKNCCTISYYYRIAPGAGAATYTSPIASHRFAQSAVYISEVD